MRRLSRSGLVFAFLALLALPPRPTAADDWRQFRHDAQRTGVSKDPVHLPLMELWSRASQLRGNMSTAAIAAGRVYFLSVEKGVDRSPVPRRALFCAAASTGDTLWLQPL